MAQWEMNNYMYYKSKYTHEYYIIEVCNCSNEIIIKIFILDTINDLFLNQLVSEPTRYAMAKKVTY